MKRRDEFGLHKKVKLKHPRTDDAGAYFQPCEGRIDHLSYLWFGSDPRGCYGVIEDKKDLTILRDWCDAILKAKS